MVALFLASTDVSPTWSPTADRVAVHRLAGDYGIYIVDTLASAETKVLGGTLDGPSELAWSPDGSHIAVLLDHDIWTVRLVDGALQQWTNIAGRFPHWPTWSPDGRFILYAITARRSGTPDSSWGLHIIDTSDGSDRAIRKQGGGGVVSLGPAHWSEDGLAIVLSSSSTGGGTSDVFVLTIADSACRQLTHLNGLAANPQWSGGGRTILFDFTPAPCPPVGSADRATWAVDADGSNLVRWPANLGDPRVFGGFPPGISIDGRRVAIVGVDSAGRAGVIQVMNVDGSNKRQLTSLP